MVVTVILYSIFREKLPPETGGKTKVSLPEGASVADLMNILNLPLNAVFSVNDELERNRDRILADGDEVRFFRQSTGG